MLGQTPMPDTAAIIQNASKIVLYRMSWKCGRQLGHCIGLSQDDVGLTYSGGNEKRIETGLTDMLES